MAESAWHRGDRAAAAAHLERARELVADSPPSPAKARVLSQASRYLAFAGSGDEALEIAAEAYELATGLGLDEVRSHALNNMSIVKMARGDPEARTDLERAVRIARDAKSIELARGLHNLAVLTGDEGRFREARSLLQEAIDYSERMGLGQARFSRGSMVTALHAMGDWEEAIDAATEFIAECVESPHYEEPLVRALRAAIVFARGDARADEDSGAALDAARQVGDTQILLPVACIRIMVAAGIGQTAEADALRAEFADSLTGRGQLWRSHAAWWICHLGGLAEAFLRGADTADTPRGATARALLAGDLEKAADLLAEHEVRADEAYARMLLAERHTAAGRLADARAPAERALAFYRSVGAVRFIERLELLTAA